MGIIRKIMRQGDPAPEEVIDDIEDLMNEEDLDGALLMTNRELVKTPNSRDLWTLKGEILSDMERLDEAIQAYDKILELDPASSKTWADKSIAFLGMDRFEDSLHAANKAIEYGLDESWVQMAKVGSLLELERYDEAMGLVEDLLEEDPKNADVLDLRAETLSGMGKHDEAIAQLEDLLDMDPWSVDTLVSLSGEHILAKNFSKALKIADKAITLARSDSMAWGNKAEALYGLGRSEEAEECILKAQNMDPADDETWYQKARILSKKRQEEALDSLLVAVSINPDNKKRARTEESFAGFRHDARFRNMVKT